MSPKSSPDEFDIVVAFSEKVVAAGNQLEAEIASMQASAAMAPIESATIRAARITAAATKLAAFSTQESTLLNSHHALFFAKQITTSVTLLATRMESLEQSSDKTGNRLARWTKWLAFGTFFLGLATAALVGVEVWAQLREHPKEPAAVAVPARPLSIGPSK